MVNVEKWYATWCAPCQHITPILDDMAAKGLISLTSLDVEQNMPAARASRVRGVPTIIVRDDDGKELARFHDHVSLQQYLDKE